MATKVYDICASIGKYTDSNGNQKNRYLNIGSVMKGDHGSFILLNRHINIAGLPCKDGASAVACSLFPPKNSQQDNNTYLSDNWGGNQPQQFNPDDNPSNIPF